MDVQRLKYILQQKEGTKLDFKAKLELNTESEKKELAKDIIAIANSIGGRGYLVIGIQDKTQEILGIDPENFSEERIQQIITYRCDPPINIRAECVFCDNKCVGVITIFKSSQRPHQMRQTGAFYIRRGSTTDFARRDEIASMLQETGIIHNELIPMYNIDDSILNTEKIREFLLKTGLIVKEGIEQQMWHSLGLIHYDGETGKFHPTLGGLLLFCDHPQSYLTYCTITIIYINGEKKDSKVIGGDLFEMMNKAYTYIDEVLNGTDYPRSPIYECVANAVVHRDYFDITRDIVVLISDNKIEISNPGTLRKGDNIHAILRENNPYRRNNWLYQKLLVLDEENRFLRTGFGLRRVNKVFEAIDNIKLLNIEKRNLFKVVLPGLKKFKQKKDDA